MADNNTKEFFIKINGIKESVTNLESLESVLQKMESQVENINKNGGFSVVSKEANKNTKEAIDLAKAEQIAQGEVVSSYKDKQKALSTLGKEIKSMTVADGEAAKKQQEMIQQYNGLNDQLKRFDASMGNHQRNVGNYENATKSVKAELKELTAQIASMLANGVDKADPALGKLIDRAGQLADAAADARQEINRSASDTRKLDDAINIAQSATAAFTLYKGAMNAFGVETEEAEKAMQKLVGAMSVIQSLQQLQDSLSQNSATAKLFHKTLQMVGLEAKTTAAATETLSTAENTATVATKGLNVGLKATKLALASLGIGLVIMLVSELVEHWEDLVGWVNKLIPGLSKTGGLMNNLKGIAVGLGKAVVNWLINPWKTFANVIGKILSGDFEGAWKAALDGVKNQFAGTVDAFKNGYQKQIEAGLEEITKKNLEETNKQTQQQLKELKIQERNNKTYSKKYIDLQKKDFAERRQLAKGNKEELDKIKLEEMQFFADVEDKKTAAAKKGAADRTKVNKEAAKAAEEEEKRIEESYKKLLTARHALRDQIINNDIIELKSSEKFQQLRVEAYDSGPIERYIDEVKKLNEWEDKIYDKEKALTIASIGDYLEQNITGLKKTSAEWQEYISNIKEASDVTFEFTEDYKNKLHNLKKKSWEEIDNMEKEELNNILTQWQKYYSLILQRENDTKTRQIDLVKKNFSVRKAELADYADDFERRYKQLIDKVTSMSDAEKVKRNPIWGTIQTGATLESLEILKKQWQKAEVDLSLVRDKMVQRWEEYLKMVVAIYGEDSSAYKKALKEKKDAFDNFQKKIKEVTDRSQSPTSTETDYTGDNQADASTKPDKKLWYGKGEKDKSGKEYSLIDNLANLATELDEMVLGPAMDTFNMFMDFAIEETQKKLEEVQEMHDEALEKVESSTERIKELNDSLKDSSNTNIEVTKQQLADEQILYAQRLAEEQKLAQEEKNLQNKANEQEYKSRQMELGYQFVMAVANTAQGASKALAQWGWPLGPIFAGTMAALGAVQSALILKQMNALPKPRKLADGGLITGPSHKQGGIQVGRTGIEVEGGEAVINKRSTRQFLPLLDAINAAGNGGKHTLADKKIRKYANGGQLNFEKVDSNLRQNTDTNRILSAMGNINFQPVVSVVDFENVQNRLVKVRSLAGR